MKIYLVFWDFTLLWLPYITYSAITITGSLKKRITGITCPVLLKAKVESYHEFLCFENYFSTYKCFHGCSLLLISWSFWQEYQLVKEGIWIKWGCFYSHKIQLRFSFLACNCPSYVPDSKTWILKLTYKLKN